MRVKTKYGNGDWIGIEVHEHIITYLVLIDNEFKSDLEADDDLFNPKPIKRRIFNCNSVIMQTDDGIEVKFGEEGKLEIRN